VSAGRDPAQSLAMRDISNVVLFLSLAEGRRPGRIEQ
jgi:hypothetical protein